MHVPKKSVMAHRSDERLAELVATKVLNRYQTGSVLDIGCGDGVVEGHLNKGTTYTGLDISDACIYEQKNDRLNIRYINATEIPETIRANGPWGTILLLDVIEHTRDFVSLFEIAASQSERVVVSLPNELFALDRMRMLVGRELNAHSLDLLGMPEGFKHQYIINIDKARRILCKTASKHGFSLMEEVRRSLVCRNPVQRTVYSLVKLVSTDQLWSMGSIFVFERNG